MRGHLIEIQYYESWIKNKWNKVVWMKKKSKSGLLKHLEKKCNELYKTVKKNTSSVLLCFHKRMNLIEF